MRIWRTFGIFVMAAIVLMPVSSAGQESSLMPTFSDLVVKKAESGQLAVTYSRGTDSLTMMVRSKVARAEDGWSGVCLENRVPVNLLGFTQMTMTIEPSGPVVMDVKLEKTKADEGTVLLADKGSFARGTKLHTWKLKEASEPTGSGTLGAAKRLCVFVLSDDFPRGTNPVTVAISRIRFDKH